MIATHQTAYIEPPATYERKHTDLPDNEDRNFNYHVTQSSYHPGSEENQILIIFCYRNLTNSSYGPGILLDKV